MDSYYLRSLMQNHSQRILRSLSDRQHLNPHQSLTRALKAAAEDLGFCPGAAENAMTRLKVSPEQSIGRMRREELSRLAEQINLFWQQAVATPQAKSA